MLGSAAVTTASTGTSTAARRGGRAVRLATAAAALLLATAAGPLALTAVPLAAGSAAADGPVPAVAFCHDPDPGSSWTQQEEMPCSHPRLIRRIVRAPGVFTRGSSWT